MDERSTDTGREKTAEEVHGSTEAGDPERMGNVGKRGRGGREARDSSDDLVSVEKAAGDRSCGVPQGDAAAGGPPDAVHTTGNKTRLMEQYRQRVRLAQLERLQKRVSKANQQPTPFFS